VAKFNFSLGRLLILCIIRFTSWWLITDTQQARTLNKRDILAFNVLKTFEEMEHRDKILIFEYIIFKLAEWEKTIQPNITHPEFSFGKLKALKLLFFVASVNATRTEHKLLDIFNRFYAMTYRYIRTKS